MESINFEHNNVNYEVRATQFENGWRVQVFKENNPVSPIYTASYEVAADFSHAGWGSVVQSLMNLAQSDVLDGRLPDLN
jgi:hypothetical protein